MLAAAICAVKRAMPYAPAASSSTLAGFVEAKDVDARPILVRIGGPLLVTVQDHQISSRDRAFEVHALARIVFGHALEVSTNLREVA